jgi:hypothetical protein
MVDEISTASQEQAQGIAEITRAINQLDQVTHSNAITSQQTASAALQLDVQSSATLSSIDELHDMIHAKHINLKQEKKQKNKNAIVHKLSEHKRKKQELKNESLFVGGEEVPSHDDPRFKDV